MDQTGSLIQAFAITTSSGTILITGATATSADGVNPKAAELLGRAPITMRQFVVDHAALWQSHYPARQLPAISY